VGEVSQGRETDEDTKSCIQKYRNSFVEELFKMGIHGDAEGSLQDRMLSAHTSAVKLAGVVYCHSWRRKQRYARVREVAKVNNPLSRHW
jgi:hypothetical protein